MELKDSKTKENLLKAFAGESQARNRYEYAAEVAKKESLFIIQELFKYTADQEKAHGEVYYGALKQFNGEIINISGNYPIGDYPDTLSLLRDAQRNEEKEYSDVYKGFAQVAREEGFIPIATTFENVASIEKVHSNRFGKYVKQMENGSSFRRAYETQWMCTNCGFIYEGKDAPIQCPVCAYPQGYYIPFEDSEFKSKDQ